MERILLRGGQEDSQIGGIDGCDVQIAAMPPFFFVFPVLALKKRLIRRRQIRVGVFREIDHGFDSDVPRGLTPDADGVGFEIPAGKS